MCTFDCYYFFNFNEVIVNIYYIKYCVGSADMKAINFRRFRTEYFSLFSPGKGLFFNSRIFSTIIRRDLIGSFLRNFSALFSISILNTDIHRPF